MARTPTQPYSPGSSASAGGRPAGGGKVPGAAPVPPSTAAGAAPSRSGGAPILLPQGQHSGKPGMAITRPFLLIGSRSRAHLHLVSSTVSKSHAALIRSDGGVYIRDLASRTHVLINGKPAKEATLKSGDYVAIGSFSFKFFDPTGGGRAASADARPAAPGALEVEGSTEPLPLEGRATVIGRRPTCDVSLIENSVSTIHAIIFEMDGKRWIRDLGSRTGTYVNGAAVHQQPLEMGAVIRIGETTFTYVQPESAESLDELEDLVGTAALPPEAEAKPAVEARPAAEAKPAPVAKVAEAKPVAPAKPAPAAAPAPAASIVPAPAVATAAAAAMPIPVEKEEPAVAAAPAAPTAPVDEAPVDETPADEAPADEDLIPFADEPREEPAAAVAAPAAEIEPDDAVIPVEAETEAVDLDVDLAMEAASGAADTAALPPPMPARRAPTLSPLISEQPEPAAEIEVEADAFPEAAPAAPQAETVVLARPPIDEPEAAQDEPAAAAVAPAEPMPVAQEDAGLDFLDEAPAAPGEEQLVDVGPLAEAPARAPEAAPPTPPGEADEQAAKKKRFWNFGRDKAARVRQAPTPLAPEAESESEAPDAEPAAELSSLGELPAPADAEAPAGDDGLAWEDAPAEPAAEPAEATAAESAPPQGEAAVEAEAFVEEDAAVQEDAAPQEESAPHAAVREEPAPQAEASEPEPAPAVAAEADDLDAMLAEDAELDEVPPELALVSDADLAQALAGEPASSDDAEALVAEAPAAEAPAASAEAAPLPADAAAIEVDDLPDDFFAELDEPLAGEAADTAVPLMEPAQPAAEIEAEAEAEVEAEGEIEAEAEIEPVSVPAAAEAPAALEPVAEADEADEDEVLSKADAAIAATDALIAAEAVDAAPTVEPQQAAEAEEWAPEDLEVSREGPIGITIPQAEAAAADELLAESPEDDTADALDELEQDVDLATEQEAADDDISRLDEAETRLAEAPQPEPFQAEPQAVEPIAEEQVEEEAMPSAAEARDTNGDAETLSPAAEAPAPEVVSPPFDPFFGMGRDMGSFIGGMPLPLPAIQRQVKPRARLPFSDSPVTYEALEAFRQPPAEAPPQTDPSAEHTAEGEATDAAMRPQGSGEAGDMFLGLDADDLGDRFPGDAEDRRDDGEDDQGSDGGGGPGPEARADASDDEAEVPAPGAEDGQDLESLLANEVAEGHEADVTDEQWLAEMDEAEAQAADEEESEALAESELLAESEASAETEASDEAEAGEGTELELGPQDAGGLGEESLEEESLLDADADAELPEQSDADGNASWVADILNDVDAESPARDHAGTASGVEAQRWDESDKPADADASGPEAEAAPPPGTSSRRDAKRGTSPPPARGLPPRRKERPGVDAGMPRARGAFENGPEADGFDNFDSSDDLGSGAFEGPGDGSGGIRQADVFAPLPPAGEALGGARGGGIPEIPPTGAAARRTGEHPGARPGRGTVRPLAGRPAAPAPVAPELAGVEPGLDPLNPAPRAATRALAQAQRLPGADAPAYVNRDVPVARPAAPRTAPAPARRKRSRLRLVLLLGIFAAVVAGSICIWLFWQTRHDLFGGIQFKGLSQLTERERQTFRRAQMAVLERPELRNHAREIYLLKANDKGLGADPGFLGEDSAVAYSQFIGDTTAVFWADRAAALGEAPKDRAGGEGARGEHGEGDTLVLVRRNSTAVAADKLRLEAILAALSVRSHTLLDEYGRRKAEHEARQTELAKLDEEIDRLQKQEQHEMELGRRAGELRAEAARLQRERDAKAKERDLKTAAVTALDLEVERLKRSVKGDEAAPGDDAAGLAMSTTRPAGADERDEQLRALLADLKASTESLEKAKAAREAQTGQAKAAFDAAQKQFDAQVTAARARVGGDKELADHVEKLQNLQAAVRQMNDALVQQWKDDREQLDSFKRNLADAYALRLKQIWDADLDLRKMQMQLSVREHKYNAAVSRQLPEAVDLKKELDDARKRVEAHRNLLAKKDSYNPVVQKMDEEIKQFAAKSDERRDRNEQMLQGMFKAFADSMPAVGKRPADQQAMVAGLEKAGTGLTRAREDYNKAVSVANTQFEALIKSLTQRVAQQQARVDERRTQIAQADAEADPAVVAAAKQERAQTLRQRRDSLITARKAKADAEAAWEAAVAKHVKAESAAADADDAFRRAGGLRAMVAQRQSAKNKLAEEVAAARAQMDRAVQPDAPTKVGTRALGDVRDRLVLAVVAIGVLLSMVTLFATRTPPGEAEAEALDDIVFDPAVYEGTPGGWPQLDGFGLPVAGNGNGKAAAPRALIAAPQFTDLEDEPAVAV